MSNRPKLTIQVRDLKSSPDQLVIVVSSPVRTERRVDPYATTIYGPVNTPDYTYRDVVRWIRGDEAAPCKMIPLVRGREGAEKGAPLRIQVIADAIEAQLGGIPVSSPATVPTPVDARPHPTLPLDARTTPPACATRDALAGETLDALRADRIRSVARWYAGRDTAKWTIDECLRVIEDSMSITLGKKVRELARLVRPEPTEDPLSLAEAVQIVEAAVDVSVAARTAPARHTVPVWQVHGTGAVLVEWQPVEVATVTLDAANPCAATWSIGAKRTGTVEIHTDEDPVAVAQWSVDAILRGGVKS